ncbi:hypothetical protein BOTBODRAFT_601720 [Botryobasidium botryosum FD-172 SS1]|uniref:Uncharacterized protein n=1 Tax=Botryobasidium botryosum (strain FD-172 SS1) TaxID=930990 RepID=A0A067N0F8_BOTB1|nr:hypothetical protein BOTBODRAFT_601720 [Botryobasidium botryosum FD-172 SS1]
MSDCVESDLGVGDIVGLAFIVEAGIFSIAFVLIFYALVLRNVIIHRKHPFQSHVDIYVTSLFMADIFQGIIAAMSWKWAQSGKVECGTHCTVQGLLTQFGQSGIAQTNMAISVHTFCVIFFKWMPPKSKRIPICVVSFIWLFNLCFAAIGFGLHTKGRSTERFYVPTPFWCWIYPSVPARIASQYFWLNLAIFTSIILYIPLFFAIRGNIEVWPVDKWYQYKIKLVRHPDLVEVERLRVEAGPTDVRAVATKMLWYPFAYTLSALPADIFRWGIINNLDPSVPVKNVPFTSIAATYFLYSLSGVIDVTLFSFTRPNILLFGDPVPDRYDRQLDEFGLEREAKRDPRRSTPSISSEPGARPTGDTERGKAQGLVLDVGHPSTSPTSPLALSSEQCHRDSVRHDSVIELEGSAQMAEYPPRLLSEKGSPQSFELSVQGPRPRKPASAFTAERISGSSRVGSHVERRGIQGANF